MATNKLQRQLNLVICLLSTRQYLTADKIRRVVQGYDEYASEEAFKRMFERDKSDLRALGIPIETGWSRDDAEVEGYRIPRGDYELPPLELSPAESAAVAVAATSVAETDMIHAVNSALLKLAAAGVEVDSPVAQAVARFTLTPATSSHPDVAAIVGAIAAHRAIRFEHATSPTDPLRLREIEPWGVRTRFGRWYVAGYDRDRDAERVFRLSRIRGGITEVPGKAGLSPFRLPGERTVDELVDATLSRHRHTVRASIWAAQGRAVELRRQADSAVPLTLAGQAGDRLDFAAAEFAQLEGLLAGYGEHTYVLEPEELRSAVIARWETVVRAAQEPQNSRSDA